MSRSVELAMMPTGALIPVGAFMLAALLTLCGCQMRPAQNGSPNSPAAPATESSPPAPSPVPFRPVPPDQTPSSQTAPPAAVPPAAVPPAAAPPAAAPATAAAQPKAATNSAKVAPKTTAPTAAPQQKPAPEPKTAATAPAPAPAAAPKPASPAALDLDSLEQRLKDTRAIGVFTKLSLKNQVDDLLDDLREFHKGASKQPPAVLRQKYDLLIMKVLSLLQNGDPPLASAISSSREALWQILMDPSKFAKI